MKKDIAPNSGLHGKQNLSRDGVFSAISVVNQSVCLFAIFMLFAASVSSQTLADPTQPPGGYVASDNDVPTVTVGPALDSVLVPKNGAPLAIISGKTVRVGESYGENRLIRVTEREAVLEGPAGIERLLLTPGIEKIGIEPTKHETKASKAVPSGSKP